MMRHLDNGRVQVTAARDHRFLASRLDITGEKNSILAETQHQHHRAVVAAGGKRRVRVQADDCDASDLARSRTRIHQPQTHSSRRQDFK